MLRKLATLYYVLVFFLATPVTALAQSEKKSFENPLKGGGINNVQDAILALTGFMLYMTVALAVGGIVFGGLKMIWPMNKEENIKDGKKIITWSIIGLIIIIMAATIIRLVGNLLGAKGA